MQDSEEKAKISSSLDRITNQKIKIKHYSEIHSERVKQRSLERKIDGFVPNPNFKNREDFVKLHHKQLFIRPADFKYKSSLYFTSTPSPREEQTLDSNAINRDESKEIQNSNKMKSIYGSLVILLALNNKPSSV